MVQTDSSRYPLTETKRRLTVLNWKNQYNSLNLAPEYCAPVAQPGRCSDAAQSIALVIPSNRQGSRVQISSGAPYLLRVPKPLTESKVHAAQVFGVYMLLLDRNSALGCYSSSWAKLLRPSIAYGFGQYETGRVAPSLHACNVNASPSGVLEQYSKSARVLGSSSRVHLRYLLRMRGLGIPGLFQRQLEHKPNRIHHFLLLGLWGWKPRRFIHQSRGFSRLQSCWKLSRVPPRTGFRWTDGLNCSDCIDRLRARVYVRSSRAHGRPASALQRLR